MHSDDTFRCCECGAHIDDLPDGLIVLRTSHDGDERYICDECDDRLPEPPL